MKVAVGLFLSSPTKMFSSSLQVYLYSKEQLKHFHIRLNLVLVRTDLQVLSTEHLTVAKES